MAERSKSLNLTPGRGVLDKSGTLAWSIFVCLACAQFSIRLIWRGGSFLDLPKYAAGLEREPFQGRALMGWVFRWTAANPAVNKILARLSPHLPAELSSPYSIVLLFVAFFSILAAIWAGRLALEELTGDRLFSAWGALLLLYMSYFNLIIGYGIFVMPYDVLSLAFFMISVWLILSHRRAALGFVFVLATLNRETSVFIPIFLALLAWFRPTDEHSKETFSSKERNLDFLLAFVLGLAWFGIRLWINKLYLGNPGSDETRHGWFTLHLVQNLKSIMKPPQWPLLLSVFGFTTPLFIAKFDSIGNQAMARATAVTMVLWTVAMLGVGVIVEIRIFNELTAFLMPCVALILWNNWFRTGAPSADRLPPESLNVM